jgi:L-ribulose-5-phosphate 4-epimerase
VVEGACGPSSDTPTHLELYKGFGHAGGIVHTHSLYATAFAQAAKPHPGHGDHARRLLQGPRPGDAPPDEDARWGPTTKGDGARDPRALLEDRIPRRSPRVLVVHHGPFSWGATAAKAVENAVALELCARLAFNWRSGGSPAHGGPSSLPVLLSRHFERKHGPKAYYGQG